jgi:hypothetical protein
MDKMAQKPQQFTWKPKQNDSPSTVQRPLAELYQNIWKHEPYVLQSSEYLNENFLQNIFRGGGFLLMEKKAKIHGNGSVGKELM